MTLEIDQIQFSDLQEIDKISDCLDTFLKEHPNARGIETVKQLASLLDSMYCREPVRKGENTTKEKYEVWRTNRFNDDILTECIGVFYELKSANGFAEYQATLGEPIAVVHEGVRL